MGCRAHSLTGHQGIGMQASPGATGGHGHQRVSSSALQIDFDWGMVGVRRLAPLCDALVLVDTLSFTTAVSVAMSRGAFVHPCRWRDDRCVELAESVGAHLAGPRRTARFSLSPDTLKALEPGELGRPAGSGRCAIPVSRANLALKPGRLLPPTPTAGLSCRLACWLALRGGNSPIWGFGRM